AVGRIDREIGEARVRVDELDVGPRLAAVGGLVDSALRVRAEQVSWNGRVDGVRVLRVDLDARDRLSLLQSHAREGLAAVGRLVDAVSDRRALPVVRFPGPDPHDVRVLLADGDVADRSRRVALEDRLPGRPVVDALPDAAGRKA